MFRRGEGAANSCKILLQTWFIDATRKTDGVTEQKSLKFMHLHIGDETPHGVFPNVSLELAYQFSTDYSCFVGHTALGFSLGFTRKIYG